MNRKQWRVVFAGIFIATATAFAVPSKPVTVWLHSSELPTPAEGGAYYHTLTVMVSAQALSLALVGAVTAGLVFAMRSPKAGMQDAS